MAMTKCTKGHIYDSAQGRCPICAKGTGGFVLDDIPATSPVPEWPGRQADIGETEPGDGFRSVNIGETEPVTNPGFTAGDFVNTSRRNAPNPYSPTVDDYDPTEPEPINGVAGFDPVVGWLVCVKGPNRGKSYNLHSGTNFIGRSREMDVCIEHDQSISKRNAASISYDDRSKTFFIQKGEVRNLIYLNGKPIRSDADIVAYDRLEIGSTELVFLPLCGEHFTWQDV